MKLWNSVQTFPIYTMWIFIYLRPNQNISRLIHRKVNSMHLIKLFYLLWIFTYTFSLSLNYSNFSICFCAFPKAFNEVLKLVSYYDEHSQFNKELIMLIKKLSIVVNNNQLEFIVSSIVTFLLFVLLLQQDSVVLSLSRIVKLLLSM